MTSSRLRVAVLMGGPSPEHDVSVSSGLQVCSALDPSRYEVIPVYLRRDGAWEVGNLPERRSLESAPDGSAPRERDTTSRLSLDALAAGLAALASRKPDVAFLAMHGAFGEDGVMQGLLTLAGLPFTGSGVLASSLAMDKLRTKVIFEEHDIPLARHAVVTRACLRGSRDATDDLLARLLADPGLPCVVKPVSAGSSVATSLVMEGEALLPALREALDADERALVEQRLVGTEVTCGVLGGGPLEASTALPLTEICPQGGAFFDFRAKYTKGASEDITPARVDARTTALVQDLARRAHDALGCEGMSRTDFIIQDGIPHALETNTLPGLTPLSLLPQEAAEAGIPFPALLDRLIRSALLRAGRA